MASTPTSTRRWTTRAGARPPSGASARRRSPPDPALQRLRSRGGGSLRRHGPEAQLLTLTQRYRYLYKPLVFVLCLAPALWLACGLFGWFGVSLGADPVKKLEHECGKTALNILLLTL